MPVFSIPGLDDPRIAIYRHLKATNQTRDRKEFVLEGLKLLQALVASRYPVESVLVAEPMLERVASLVPSAVPIFVLPRGTITELVGFNFHQGVLCCGRRLPEPSLAGIVPPGDVETTLLITPRLDNPENLGTILRLADVFGVDGLIVGGRCPDPLSRRVLRVSMGASLRVPVVTTLRLAEDWDWLRREQGVTFAATVTDPRAIPVDAYDRPARLAIVLGSESAGLAPEWQDRCDERITIPMRAGADSLNVAVATGIMLFLLTRPR